MRDPNFDALRHGTEKEAREIYEELMFRSDQYERLRPHAVPQDEIELWRRLYSDEYPDRSKAMAARMIKQRTSSRFSGNTIRRYL